MAKLPDIQIDCHYVDVHGVEVEDPMRYSRFIARWQDDRCHYHLWIESDGTLDKTIGRNLINETRNERKLSHFQRYRALDATAAVHAPIIAAIKAMATPAALKTGWETARAFEQATKAKITASRLARQRAAVEAAVACLKIDGAAEAISYCTDEQIENAIRALRINLETQWGG